MTETQQKNMQEYRIKEFIEKKKKINNLNVIKNENIFKNNNMKSYKIYKVVNPTTNDIFIGYTSDKYINSCLCNYKWQYRNNRLPNRSCFHRLFSIDIDKCYTELLEEISVDDVDEVISCQLGYLNTIRNINNSTNIYKNIWD